MTSELSAAAESGPGIELSMVLVVQRDAVRALRCLPALVAAVPADVEAELLVLALGLDDIDARPLDTLQGSVEVVRTDPGVVLGAALVSHLPAGRRIVVVDGDMCAPGGASDGSALEALVDAARRPGAVADRDAYVTGFARIELVAGESVFGYAVDAPSLTAIGTILRARASAAAVPMADLGERPVVPRPADLRLTNESGVAGGSDVAVVTVVPAGLTAAETREVLRRRRELTRHAYTDVIVCVPGADGALRSALPHAIVVAALPWASARNGAAGLNAVAGWNSALNAARGHWAVVAVPFASRFGRFWLEGLLAALGPDVAAVLPRDARWLTGVRAGERFAAFAERTRQELGHASTRIPASIGAAVLLRGALLGSTPLDEGFDSLSAAWQDRAAGWLDAGWQLRRADGVLIDDDHDDAELFAGLWHGAMQSGDIGRLVARRGLRALPDSVCAAMIVKNEQAVLPRALASLVGIVDDVVVADTGSADETVALAEALGARVVHVPWTDDFAAARNAGLAYVASTWAFVVDADEEAEVGGALRVRAAVRRSVVDALMVPVNHLTGTVRQHEGMVVVPGARLFHSLIYRYDGRIHEQVVRLDGGAIHWTVTDALRLVHRGYLIEVVAEKDKGRRNAEIARARFQQEGGWLAAYECGRALMLASDPVEAEPFLRLAAEGISSDHAQASMLFRVLAQAAAANDRPDVLDLARRSVALRPSDVDSVLKCAELLVLGGEPLEAIATIDGFASAGPDAMWNNSLAAEVKLPMLRGKALAVLGRPDEALEALREVAKNSPGSFVMWRLLIALLADRDDNWPAAIARLAKRAPQQLVHELQEPGFDAERRRALFSALRDEGVEVLAMMAEDLDSVGALHDDGASDVEARARKVELTRPDSALEIWRTAPPSVDRAAGEARCLVALGRPAEAYACVRVVEPTDLRNEDRVLAAALALDAGDPQRTLRLLDAAPLPPSLHAEEAALRSVAASTGATL